ncbi:MAG: ABC transporter substrate-binding protein [Proteobacteria bacterium]|nr:ABC transporter substrate-binding protein [Pseudomonadota bacterium]MBU4297534.1 ABC transporter substrate-binding protein [Pseudomonadota bacterium]MCG2749752.1 ABC transporter substrate-binding protein [Desulfobulbaceae bacterium]
MKKINKLSIAPLLMSLSLTFFIFINTSVPCHAANEPMDQLRDTVNQIVDILRRDDPGEQWVTKKEEIVKIVKSRFASHELAQRVLALNWRARTGQEKEQFVSLFSQVLETTYINRLKSYSDEEVTFKKQIVNNDKAIVYSEIVKNNQEIPIVYRVKDDKGQWLIYDIIIEGVSLVQNYRQQFDRIIKNEGYDGLVRRMEEKIQENQQNDIEAHE